MNLLWPQIGWNLRGLTKHDTNFEAVLFDEGKEKIHHLLVFVEIVFRHLDPFDFTLNVEFLFLGVKGFTDLVNIRVAHKKTRIVGSMKRARGIRGFPTSLDEYLVYQTEDGRLISDSFRRRKDELDASQVFLSKDDAVQYIIYCLQCEINSQKHSLLNAQQRLAQAEQVLKTYEKYGRQDLK